MKAKTKKTRIVMTHRPKNLLQDGPLSAFLSLFSSSADEGRQSKSRDTWFFDLLKTDDIKDIK
jgi:hypothetical protein